MSAAPRPSPVFVSDPDALSRLLDALAGERVLALDTESNSFHVYRERVCLLQLSTRAQDFVVDPISVDVRPLGEILCDGREVVLHGADYDVRCLHREYGWRIPRLFDTMIAARRLGRPGLGLSALVEAHFGVRLSKAFQRSDWGRRPLTPDQLAYASLDTHFLLPLFDLLTGELATRGALEEAWKESQRIASVVARERVFDPEGWRRIKGSRELDAPGKAVLRALWIAREDRARASDRPPFKVLGEPAMLEIARRRPATREALAAIPGVTPSVLGRMGETIAAALKAAG
ncbi:3'-5' exonuclease [Anaeromyxobacter dehalogenans 2CP-1]|uniref:3'-5' exonuclease n=1 Tax=Anaeromyxobacter dehalogenans (strain ATCC BAA-258 / DSM 21875 / 2CP-1) TaxID=455488 RepID=B8JB60_ANAD2|nr:ribonuclease D [Anaeromyxobacter dehalogenans]ACL65687.1 3'-5' exonuclease [Anaeromyxobacter dehalogenans 2CP-1]